MSLTNHSSYESLEAKLADASMRVEVGAKYLHYKHPGDPYKVINLGLLEATEEVCVIYQNLENNVIWVRTIDKFLDTVEWNGQMVPRFAKLS